MIERKQTVISLISTPITIKCILRKHQFEQTWAFYRIYIEQFINTFTSLNVILNMMLILLLLRAGSSWYVELPITLLCMAAILYRPLLQNPNFWFVATVILAAANYQDWYSIDNHKYLITYCCLAIWLSLLAPFPEQEIAHNARLLIGFCRAIANFGK